MRSLFIGLTAAALLGAPAAGQVSRATPQRHVQIHVNGESLGTGIRIGDGARVEDLFLGVADLQRAVDGAAADAGPTRLNVNRSSLYAASRGGCDGCRLRVNRTVVISRSLRLVDGAPYLPLPDLIRALEGRVTLDAPGDVLTIHVGRCDWCILEPRK